jgi:drug/metabolite transporter (DMT)-like permease
MAFVFLISYVGVVSMAYFSGRRPVVNVLALGILVLNGLRVALVYVIYHAAVRRLGALLASVIVALKVPLTMLWDSRLLNQPPVRNLVFGAAAIVLGAMTLAWDRFRHDWNGGKARLNSAQRVGQHGL